jgi:hypothetical protein
MAQIRRGHLQRRRQAGGDALKQLQKQAAAILAGLASAATADAWLYHDQMPPGLDFDSKGRLRMSQRRADSVRLVLSRAWISNGAGPDASPTCTVQTPRWTPPQAVELEDMIDLLDHHRDLQRRDDVPPAWCSWPASPSAHAIQQIALRRGRERGGRRLTE